MNGNQKLDVYKYPDGNNFYMGFKWAAHAGYSDYDSSGPEQFTLEKLGFAIKAINRWNAFVDSVERSEVLIRTYENLVLPEIGGDRHE